MTPNRRRPSTGPATGLRVVQPDPQAGPNTFTAEAWFKTTTTSGGKILGFGNAATGDSSNYDRQIYMDNTGRLYFGVYPNGVQTLNTTRPTATTTGSGTTWWPSLGAGGMRLYVDGALVGAPVPM